MKFFPDLAPIPNKVRMVVVFILEVVLFYPGLEVFCQCNNSLTSGLRSAILAELHKIRAWFQKQRVYLIRCSSILIVYDASQLSQTSSSTSEAVNGEVLSYKPRPQVRVKMIDFAHVLHAFGEEDENYKFGLDSVIKFFSKEISWSRDQFETCWLLLWFDFMHFKIYNHVFKALCFSVESNPSHYTIVFAVLQQEYTGTPIQLICVKHSFLHHIHAIFLQHAQT